MEGRLGRLHAGRLRLDLRPGLFRLRFDQRRPFDIFRGFAGVQSAVNELLTPNYRWTNLHVLSLFFTLAMNSVFSNADSLRGRFYD